LHKGATIICSSTEDKHGQRSSLLPSAVQQLPPPGTKSPGGAVLSKSTEGEQKVLEVATPTKQVAKHMPTHAPGTKRGHTPGSCLHQMFFWRAGIRTMYRPVSLGQPSASQLCTRDLSHSSGISHDLKGTAQLNVLQHSLPLSHQGKTATSRGKSKKSKGQLSLGFLPS